MTPSEKEIQLKEDENTSIKNQILVLPYQGERGTHIVYSMKRYASNILPKNIKSKNRFYWKRLSSCFKAKARAKFERQLDIIYQVKCSA